MKKYDLAGQNVVVMSVAYTRACDDPTCCFGRILSPRMDEINSDDAYVVLQIIVDKEELEKITEGDQNDFHSRFKSPERFD